MNVLRIHTDPNQIPTFVYEFDLRNRHAWTLTVLDAGDRIEVHGELVPAADPIDWADAWRAVITEAHGHKGPGYLVQTGNRGVVVGEVVTVRRKRSVSQTARLTGVGVKADGSRVAVDETAHRTAIETADETHVVAESAAWQPGLNYDAFYGLPAPSDAPAGTEWYLDTEYQRGVGERPGERLSSAVPAPVYLAATLDWEQHGGWMFRPGEVKSAPWEPITEGAKIAANVVDIAGTNAVGIEPESDAVAASLGLNSREVRGTFELFACAIDDWSLAGSVSFRFQSDPASFVEWVRENRDDLRGAAEELVSTPPKKRKTSRRDDSSPAKMPSFDSLRAAYDAIRSPADLGVAEAPSGVRASDILMLVSQNDIAKVIAAMTETLTHHQKNGNRP